MTETMPEETEQKDPRLRKAALILTMMGAEQSVEVAKRVDPLSAHRLIRSLNELGDEAARGSTREDRVAVLRELIRRLRDGDTSAGSLAAKLRKSVLSVSQHLPGLSGDEAEVFLERLALLDKADAAFIWRALSGEMPQTIALVASNLSAPNVAKLLATMPAEVREEVAFRMVMQGSPTPDAVSALSQVSDRFLRIAATGGEMKDAQTRFFVDVVSQMDRTLGRDVLAAIRQRNETIALAIEQRMFTFQDLLKLPPIHIQAVLRNVTTADLALAMKGLSDAERDAVLTNLSKRGRAVLAEEVNLLGAVPLQEVERAQREIVQAARALEAAGEIQLQAGTVEYVE